MGKATTHRTYPSTGKPFLLAEEEKPMDGEMSAFLIL
jgi:hypothetical protein